MSRLESAKIGPYLYDVVYTGESIFESAGCINFHEHKIYIREGMNKCIELETILHEILHGIHDVMGLEDSSSEEEFTRGGATGLLMVLRDNPDLLELISDFFENETGDD